MNIHKPAAIVLVGSISFLLSLPGFAFEWSDLWSTPEQRASKQLGSGQYDELVREAPNKNWQGLGEYRKGDYEAAAKSFAEQRASAQNANNMNESVQALYNEANANVLGEQYGNAIELFDELLEIDPEHANAQHNRAIADQLLQQQQQQQEQQSGDQGDEQQDQQDQQPGDQQQESKEQNSEKQDGESESDQQQSNNSEGTPEDEQQSGGSPQDEQSQAEEDAQAAKALAAEKQAQEAEQQQEKQQNGAAEDEELLPAPLTEREQANEQWLRQIPDDPAGLLQRKIQNRHMTDYPKVKDSVKAW